MICPPDHKHAQTRTCRALHGCECLPCRDAKRLYQKQRKAWIAQGVWGDQFVDPAEARKHVDRLTSLGASHADVATAAGISGASIHRLMSGETKRLTVKVEDAILAVTSPEEGDVETWRVTRRVQALACLGYSATYLAERIGCGRDVIQAILSDRWHAHVRRRVYRGVFDLFTELQMTQRTSDNPRVQASITRTRRLAAANGYAPPAAWDDIDDPTEESKGVAA